MKLRRRAMEQPQPSASFRTAGFEMESRDAARYRAFVEQNAAGIAEVTADGRFRLVNRRFCEITGYSEEELTRLRFQDITHPDDLPVNLEKLLRLLQEGAPYDLEKRYIRKDGTEVSVLLSVSLIVPSEGATPSVLAVVLDVTEWRRAEAAARLNEESYKALFNSIDSGFCVIEMIFDADERPVDYVFLETNAGFELATGLANAKGARMRELAPTHEQHWFDMYGRVAKTGEPARFEQEARALQRWYSVFAFRIGEAETNRVAVLFDDITMRKTADQRRLFLADLSEKLAPLRNEAEIVHAAVNALGRFLQVDRCFFVECLEAENRIIISENYTREGTPSLEGEMTLFEFGGMEWWRRISAGSFSMEDVRANPLTEKTRAAYEKIGVRSYLAEPFKREGPWTNVLSVTDATPRAWTADDAKLVEEVVVRVWPVVERARSERALTLAHNALEERVAERTAKLKDTISELESYSYSISHDLRAPLRAMQTYASILATDCAAQLDAEGKEYLRRIMAAAERMDRLIRDVLVFSRVARVNMPMERIELGSFIASVIESYPGLSLATAEIEVVTPLGAVRANPAALTQCVSNLLGNAIKFVAPGVKPRIRVWSAREGEQRVRLFFRDNGIGIPPDAHEKIFGMFYQLDPRQDGTGVGLAVIKRAVERMGGQVGLASTPGIGSTFWIELERADSHMPL